MLLFFLIIITISSTVYCMESENSNISTLEEHAENGDAIAAYQLAEYYAEQKNFEKALNCVTLYISLTHLDLALIQPTYVKKAENAFKKHNQIFDTRYGDISNFIQNKQEKIDQFYWISIQKICVLNDAEKLYSPYWMCKLFPTQIEKEYFIENKEWHTKRTVMLKRVLKELAN